MRATLDRTWRVTANGLGVVLIVLAAHSWPAREHVRLALADAATRHTGLPVSIGRLRYNLLTLQFDGADVLLEPAHHARVPRIHAGHVALRLSWRAVLAGRLGIDRLVASDIDVLSPTADSGIGVDLERLSLSASRGGSGALSGRVALDAPGRIRIGSRMGPLERLDGFIAFNEGSVALTGVHLSAPGFVADVTGTVSEAFSGTAQMSINGSWHGRAAELCDTWLSHDTCELVQNGSLRGRFTLSGGIASPVLHIDLEEGLLAGQTKQIAVAGEAIVSPRSIEVPQLRVAAFGGTALVRGSVTTAGPLHVPRATLTWNGMDARDVLGAVGVAAPVAGTIAGEAVLTGEPMSPSTMVLDARGSLARGTARAGLSLAGGMTARLAGGRWSVSVADARIGATSIQGVASGRVASSYDARAWLRVPLDGSLLLETTDAGETMRTLGALGVDELPAMPDAWNARAAARVRLGGTIGRPAATARFQVTAVHSIEADPLVVDAELNVDAAAVRVESLQAVLGDDRLEGGLSYQRATGEIEAAFTATAANLGSWDDLFGAAGWSLRGEAAAAGQISGTMLRPRARAVVRASGVEVISPGIPDVPGVTTVSLGDVSANVTFEDRIEFRVDLPARRIAAAGALDRKPGWPFDVSVALRDVDVGELITRSATAPAITGMLDGTVALAGQVRPAEWRADLRLSRAQAVLQGIEARLVRPGRVRIESSRVVEASLDLSVGDLQFRVARGDAMDAVHVLVEGSLPSHLFAPFDGATTRIDAAITPRGIEIRKAQAQWEGATAEASAQLPMWLIERWLPVQLHGLHSEDQPDAVVRLEARAIPVAAVTRRLFPDGDGVLQGVFDVVLEADAAAPSVDAIRLDGRIERSRLDIAGMVLEQQGAAAVVVRAGEASLTGWSLTSPGAALALRARSTIGHDFETVVTGDLDLGTALQLAGNRTAGIARVDMAVRADPEGMSWNGQMELRDVGWVSRRRRLALTDVNGILACSAQGCRVEAFDGQLNGGTVRMTGVVPMRGAASTGLQMTLRGIALELPPGTRHDVDADLELGGIGLPRITGMATVWPGPVNDSLTSLASLIASSYGGRVLAPPRDAATAALSRVPLDVRVVTGDDLTFASHDLQVTATADLTLRGTLARPLLLGEVAALDRGSVFLTGRTWDLERATVSLLDRPDGAEVRIAVALTTRISQYLVQIAMSGPARQPALVMTSDPPLGQSDLAELVLTGTTGGSFSAGGHQVASLVSGELLSSVGRIVGMDAVRIEQHQSDLSAVELEPVARLTVSKRITDTFEVVYSQGLSEEDDLAWILIFRPGWGAVDVRATIRTNGAEAYEIRQELEFGHPARTSRQSRPRRPSAMVSRVDIVGVSAEEAVAVSRALSIRAGDEFTTDGWQRDRQAVSEYFRSQDRFRVRVRAARAEVSDGTYVLSYDIAPGPITRLEVRGYTPDETTLASLREAWGRVAADDLLVEELTDVLRIELAERGYLDAAVSTTFTSLADGGRAVVVEVSPGTRSRGRSIKVAGNAAVSTEDVARAIAERQVGPRSWLVPSLLEEPVTELYSARGFLAARVTAVRTVSGRAATLNVHIDEGPAFKVGTVVFSGTAWLGEAAVRESFGLAPGAPFAEASVSRAVAGLRAAYLRAGYLDADVDSASTVSRERGVVDLAVAVREGQPSVLRDIQVEGRGETSASLVAAALGVTAGGAADPVALDEAQQRLYDTGIFRTVDVDIQPLDESGASATDRAVRAVVTVEERPRYRLRYGIQFGPTTIEDVSVTSNSAEPGATFDLQRRNLFGKGIVAGGGAIWSADQHRIRGTMSAATFRGRFVSTTLTAEHVNQDRESETGTQVVDRSARAVLEQRWRWGRTRRVEMAYGFDVEQRRVELWTTPTTIPLPLEGRFADLNATFVYDTRDNRFNPRRGTFHASRVESGAGFWISDVAFARYQVQQFAYTPIGAVTLASGVRFASLDVDNEREPAALLLYFKTGGGTSVRGYDTDSLTPAYLGGVPVGGKVLLVLNEEVRVHATRRVGVAAFVDAGNTFEGFETFDAGALKIGVGAGLRFETPVAVLRLDVGLPMPPPQGGPRARWYLSLGQPF